MFHKIIDRSLGRWRENRRAHQRCPELPKSVFLERFENVEADRHFIYGLTDSDDVALPMTCRFGRDRYSHVCSVGDESGLIMLFNTEKGAKGPLFNEWQAHSNAVFDMAWLDSDSKMLTASGDQTVVLWDLKTQAAVTSFRGHCCSVRSVAPSPTIPAVLATGSRDGHIMLWDCRNNKKGGQYHTPVKSIQFAHCLLRPGDRAKDVKTLRRKSRCEGPPLDTQQSVTSVLFQSENLLLSSGAVDGCVKVWDMRKTYSSTSRLPMPLHTFDYAGSSHIQRRKGIISLELDVWGSRVFANCTDSTVYCFDIVRYSKEPVCQYVGHRSDTFFSRMSVSPDGTYLLSGSSNSGAYIWKIDKPEEPPVRLVGHRDDVSAVAWCPKDITRLVTVGDDSTFRIWRLSQRELSEKDIMVCGQAEISALGMQALTPYSPSSLLGGKCSSRVESESLAKSPRKRPADQKQHFSALPQDQLEINFIKKSKDTQSLSICKRPGEVILSQNSSPAATSTRISVTHSPSKLLRLSSSPRKAEVENSPTKQKCVKLAYDAATEKLSPSKRDFILDNDEARERLAKRPCLINLSNNSPSKEGVPFVSPAHIPPSCREEQIIVPKPPFLNSPTVNLPNHVLDAPQEKSNAANTDSCVSSLKTDWLTTYRLSLPHIPVSKGENLRSGAVSPSTPKRRAFPHSSERTSISTPKRKLGATVGTDETNTCTTPKILKVTSPRMPRSSGKGGNQSKEAAIPGSHGRTNNLPSARMSIKHFFQ